MKILKFSLVAYLFLTSCDKNVDKLLFKGKYIGEGCFSVVQILEPADPRFQEQDSWWRRSQNDSLYTSCVSMGLPDEYKSGKPFYFTVKEVRQDLPVPTDCVTPKYDVVADAFSESPIVK